MNATETIVGMINHTVMACNTCKGMSKQSFERFRHELMGMLICLKNISSDDNFYCINVKDDSFEFGYFDNDGRWFVIAQ